MVSTRRRSATQGALPGARVTKRGREESDDDYTPAPSPKRLLGNQSNPAARTRSQKKALDTVSLSQAPTKYD